MMRNEGGLMGSRRQVATLLYRSLLGLIHKHGLAPALTLIPSARAAELCGLSSADGLPPHDVSTLEGASWMLRWAFEEKATLAIGSIEGEKAIDHGFEALRLFNLLKSIQDRRSMQEDRSSVYYSLGHVVRHRKLGYRGIIYGWDPCRMLYCESLAKHAPLELPGTEQPFYYILPDEVGGRCTKAKYVGQDKVEILVGGRVRHRSLSKYFTRYSSKLGRYMPVAHLRYLYPDVYSPRDDDEDIDSHGSRVKSSLGKCKEEKNSEMNSLV